MADDAFGPRWSIANPPPAGDRGVGDFAFELWQAARADKEDRQIPDRHREDYRLFRGDHWRSKLPEHRKHQLTVNLLGYYREKNVISLCSRDPKAEVKVIGGRPKNLPAETGDKTFTCNQVMNTKLEGVYSEIGINKILRRAVHTSETYGCQISRFIPMLRPIKVDGAKYHRCLPPVIEPNDPFGHFYAPGNYGQPSDGSHHIVGTIWDVDVAKKFYLLPDGTEPDIQADTEDALDIGADDRRSMTPPVREGQSSGAGFPSDWVASQKHNPNGDSITTGGKCLILECWMKDRTEGKHKEFFEEMVETEEGKKPRLVEREVDGPIYPGFIRMITICASNKLVLRDTANPSINHGLPRAKTSRTFLYDKFPLYTSLSYKDEYSPWGFSLAEQIGPINLKIDELLSKILKGVLLQINPIMVVSKAAGIDVRKIKSGTNTILELPGMLTGREAYYVEHPGLSSDGKWLLTFLLQLSDQLASHQEVDRGQAPSGVIAASAITALQEQNRTMRENKISEVDQYVQWIGMCLIAYLQNFHWESEDLIVQDDVVKFRGWDHMDYRYDYTVRKGSTYIQSDSQKLLDAIELFKLGSIDTLALNKRAGLEDAEEIYARMYGAPMAAAIQSLLDSKIITAQDAALLRGKLEATKAGQVPQNSGMEAPMPGLQATVAGGEQPQMTAEEGEVSNAAL
jgi:hypothetical protein